MDASPAQRRRLWESTVRMLAEGTALNLTTVFPLLRTGASSDGVGDCLDYWQRSLRWAAPESPVPLADEVELWLLARTGRW